MKILEIAPFSSGICGVWARVSKESELLAKKGNEVVVFSSNIKRGSGKIEYAQLEDKLNGVKIKRFKTFAKFGDNTFFWNYEREAIKFKPDLIITHAYRQYYSTKALKIAKKLKIPCVLVTHAPFLEKKLRDWKLNLMVSIYDNFVGKKIINQYDKIFAITKWEIPYLLELGAEKNKIIYIPNGIPEEFFSTKISTQKNKNKILFLGRIAPIKNIEILIKALKICLEKNKKLFLEFIGPAEEDCLQKLKILIKELKLEDKIRFNQPVYDLKQKIKAIDDTAIFVLPSKREGMPQALIEAMSREKIVISSKTDGGNEIIVDGKNGYLFKIGDENELAKKILIAVEQNSKNKKIEEAAKKYVEQFSWKIISDKIEKILNTLVKIKQ